MELNPYNPISNLDTSTYEWKCYVRVHSFWKGMNRESQEFWGLNMILIDDSVCKPNHVFVLKFLLDSTYVINHFSQINPYKLRSDIIKFNINNFFVPLYLLYLIQ